MDIKLIAMDMDGTLLQKDNTISQRTKEALWNAEEQGIRLVLASGRSYRKLMSYAKELRMEQYGGYLIEVNGIALYDLKNDDRTVFHQLQHQDLHTIFTTLQRYEVEILGLGDDAMYDYIPASMMEEKRNYRKEHHLSADHPWTAGAFAFLYDNRKGYPLQKTVMSVNEYPETLNKIAVAHLPAQLEAQLPMIKAALQDRYWLGLTSPGWLEIMPQGVTKGSALTQLSKQLGISMEHVMAFGDGENDIEMLEAVGHGVAMANALENVKTYARYVCNDHEHDGIAQMVEPLLQERQSTHHG